MNERNSRQSRCASHCSRRTFLVRTCGTAALGPSLLAAAAREATRTAGREIKSMGPASKYTPVVKAAFVRREGDYGIRWPGAIYDGEAARKKYTAQLETAERQLQIKINMAAQPIYSKDEGAAWLAEAKSEKSDGLLVILLDRQEHAWPTATMAVETKIPTIVFAPVGAAFTTNTAGLAKKSGVFVCSTDSLDQVVYGLKMLRAWAKMREMRFVVIQGKARRDAEIAPFGTKLRYVPAETFLNEYNNTAVDAEIKGIAAEYINNATRISGPIEQDVINGVKSFVVARNFLEREEGDGITMDCLGALGKTKVSLPCIAWSRMLDHAIPAACEADIGAALTHALVQYLFDRPGFQQDPVAETAKGGLIGAHCTCPTRLDGFSQPPAPYYLCHHHGMRDAVPRPTWRVGQRATVADIELGKVGKDGKAAEPPHMWISSGTVEENISVPPSGGCVVSVLLKLDGVSDFLDYPGFHQLFFYGDYKKELRQYCQLFGIEARVV